MRYVLVLLVLARGSLAVSTSTRRQLRREDVSAPKAKAAPGGGPRAEKKKFENHEPPAWPENLPSETFAAVPVHSRIRARLLKMGAERETALAYRNAHDHLGKLADELAAAQSSANRMTQSASEWAIQKDKATEAYSRANNWPAIKEAFQAMTENVRETLVNPWFGGNVVSETDDLEAIATAASTVRMEEEAARQAWLKKRAALDVTLRSAR